MDPFIFSFPHVYAYVCAGKHGGKLESHDAGHVNILAQLYYIILMKITYIIVLK